MRIVQAVGWYFPDSLGGTEVYVATLAAQLTRRGHEVIVAAPEPGGRIEREYIHDGVRVFRYPTALRVSRAQARGRACVPGAERFHDWLRTIQADVVHFHTFVTGLSLPEVIEARQTGARVIVTSHAGSLGFLCARGTLMRDGETPCDAQVPTSTCAACALTQRGLPRGAAELLGGLPEAVSSLGLSLPARLGTAIGMRALVAQSRRDHERLFREIDAFVVLSQWAADALRASGAPPEKIIVNRLGVAATLAKPARGKTSRPVVCGFVGRAEPIKGLEDAVRAITMLRRDCDVRLRAVVIAANDVDRAVIHRCRELAANDSRIQFEPAVAPHAVGALLSSLDLLLCPSRVIEGGPTVALEARAVGTPVIGSRLPALSEIVRDGVDGRLHAPGDVRALADCLREVTADPTATIDAWRARLNPARTTEAVAAEYLELYRMGAASGRGVTSALTGSAQACPLG